MQVNFPTYPHHAPLNFEKRMYDFTRALMQEKWISVELQVKEVIVHAGHKNYPSIRASFRNSITVGGLFRASPTSYPDSHLGFDYFKNHINVERIRITGSDENGNSLTARADIVIKNSSNGFCPF